MKTNLLFLGLLFFTLTGFSQQETEWDFYDNYSNPLNWSQVGTGVEVRDGKLFFDNARDKYYQKRAVRELGVTLNDCDTWIAEFEFTPTDLGDWTGIDDAAGHDILALTAGKGCPTSDCSCDEDCSKCGYPPADQDAVICMLVSDRDGGNVGFELAAKAKVWEQRDDSLRILLPEKWKGVTFYLRMERTGPREVQLGVFYDAERTQPLPGSPYINHFEGEISGLNTIQHANHPRGHWPRNLWGTVDNLKLKWDLKTGNDPFSVFPSPDEKLVRVRFADCCGKPVNLHLVDANGQLIEFRENVTGGKATFQTGMLEPGLYYVQVACKEWMKAAGFVVKDN